MDGYSRSIAPFLVTLGVLLAVGCSGGSSDPDSPNLCGAPQAVPSSVAEPTDLESQLERVVLRTEDLPASLQRSSIIFSPNEDLAQSAPDAVAELARLDELGRLLGVEVAFVPRDPGSELVVKGGIQNSVSLYRAAEGASQSLQEGVAGARQTDWVALYTDLKDVSVDELPREIGDESVWFRVSGLDQAGKVVVDDQVVFRVGRARAFLRIISSFADAALADQFASEVETCAEIVVGRARADFAAEPAGLEWARHIGQVLQ